MKTKSLLFCLLFSGALYSQIPEDPFFRMTFSKEKRQMVKDFLRLEDAQANKFWPIYNDYEVERQRIGTARIRLIEDYIDKYDSLSEDALREMGLQALDYHKQINKLHKKYFKRVAGATTGRTAASWMLLEEYIYVATRMEIMDQLPFVGKE